MAIIGAILGDIAGSQYEFTSLRPQDLNWRECDLFTKKCRVTDDSIMSIATLKAIQENPENPNFAYWYRAMGNKYSRAGYGGMFRKWLADSSMGPYNSFGNGSAMRVSPVVDMYKEVQDIAKYSKESAIVTHNHPQGVKGAKITAMCALMAKNGLTKENIGTFAYGQYGDEETYKYPIGMSLADMRKIYKWDVTCQGSVPAAITCFLESKDYETFLRNVFSLRCDMDTLAAIGGGLAEEYYGKTGFDDEKILRQYLDDFCFDVVKPFIK